MNLQLSASDVNYLAPGKTIRGVVSENANKFKVYELFINKMLFPEDQSDLFITLTPCKGLLNFHISDSIENLFTEESQMNNDNNQD
jgi:hypothetical protein